MEEKCLNRMIDKYCKIVTKDPGKERIHVIFGIVIDIDHDSGLIVVESNPGLMCLNIETIVTIKPSNQKT